MNIKEILLKTANKIAVRKNTVLNFPLDKQKEYLNSLKEPKDDLERSYFQYKCQAYLDGNLLRVVLNIIFFPLSIFMLVKYGNKKYLKMTNASLCKKAVFINDEIPENVLPNSLYKEFDEILIYNKDENYLSKNDLLFIKKIIFRYPLSWHFIFKIIIKISRYRALINKYNPSAIIVCNEYSFTSSVLTYFCNLNGIKHIDVMHGEKLFYIRDSFFKYDRCYIWDEYYLKLFSLLRVPLTQFFIEEPPSLIFKNDIVKEKIDYVFYLQAESNEELNVIFSILAEIKNKNTVLVRMHPTYSNKNEIEKLSKKYDIPIEDNFIVGIEESVLRTKNVISLYSSVLNQAYHSGKNIIIDDLSRPKDFKKLKERGYIMLSVNHRLLSEIVEENKN